MPEFVHHVGICPADFELSLQFYRDGLGLDLLFDWHLDTDLEPLLGIRTEKVRTVFLGKKDQPEVGAIELLDFGDGAATGDAEPAVPRRGLCLVSFQLPVEPALARLAELGLGGQPRRVPTPRGGLAASVRDPDATIVELLDQPMSVRIT